MTILVPVMLIGWIPVNIILFRKFTPQKAILISVIGGILFLPVTGYDIPLIDYKKNVVIAISLLLGIIFSGKITDLAFRLRKIDIPIILWCIISPLLSIVVNSYALKHALYAVVNTSLEWGVYYIVGRIFFSDKDALRLLCRGIIIGGLIYVPLTLFEVKMSPQLSYIFYGFNPISWEQLVRYEGFRPLVFMDHGLMVALWMATAYIVAFWLFRTGEIIRIKNISMALIVFLLLITTILCKCTAAYIYLILGTLGYYYKKSKSKIIFKIIILSIPGYIILRLTGILPVDTILDNLSEIFNTERMESLATRLYAEEVFTKVAFEMPLFGWGGMDRAWPLDPVSGESTYRIIDSLYLAIFSVRGFLGLISFYAVLLLGPWKMIKSRTESVDAVVLSIVVTIFAIDTVLNAMINPVFVLISGSLISASERFKNDKLTE